MGTQWDLPRDAMHSADYASQDVCPSVGVTHATIVSKRRNNSTMEDE